VAHREYARRWGGNSGSYDRQGVYDWLAGHLGSAIEPRSLLDIGCGRGEGMAALRRRFCGLSLLVGLDENPHCLAAAAERLGAEPPAVRLVRRPGEGRVFDIDLAPGRLPAPATNALAQVDILREDLEFEDWIISLAPFDAVTMWFTGIHPARQMDAYIRSVGIQDDRMHRMVNDFAIFDLACGVVPPGGVLQIVNRAKGHSEAEAQSETIANMTKLAQRGPFIVADVAARRYTEPVTGPRIGLGAPDCPAHYAISTIFGRIAN